MNTNEHLEDDELFTMQSRTVQALQKRLKVFYKHINHFKIISAGLCESAVANG